jgi:uncharacterized coiled-coil DUF342 family protein
VVLSFRKELRGLKSEMDEMHRAREYLKDTAREMREEVAKLTDDMRQRLEQLMNLEEEFNKFPRANTFGPLTPQGGSVSPAPEDPPVWNIEQ